MKCTNCGNEVPDHANVCGHCGHRLKASPPLVMEQGRALPSSTFVIPSDRWKSILLWAIPICVIQFAGTVAIFLIPYLQTGAPGLGRQGVFSLLNEAFQWGYTDVNTQALIVLGFFGLPGALTGYLVAGNKSLQRWALTSLAVFYIPWLMLYLILSLGNMLNSENLLLDALYRGGIFSGFSPLMGVLMGILFKKFSR